jgi:hypothetical protein
MYASSVGFLGHSVGGMATASLSVFKDVKIIHRKGVMVYKRTRPRIT